ncbi:MAG TPA: D-alanine--D-alanine ligase, partial [Myxococcaceae bacterium]|nr:D-alanine--D-alanine ligase [Myxococcaceae bacterium]
MGKRVGVLMGGWGEEREISIKSGEAIAAALERRAHRVTRILAGPQLDGALRAAEIDV